MVKATYKKSGVDIKKADKLIKKAGKLIESTNIKGVMGSVGGFAGFFDLSKTGVKDPLLVAATDGVGTKLKVAQIAGVHSTVGTDLVAMCVNDIICTGGKPVFFLDYFAAGRLDGRIWNDVVKSIIKACRESDCALLGGETAEMPGMYGAGEYDLAGFSVGLVDRKKMIDGRSIKAGDVILGIASSGLHSNGFSLVRKIYSKSRIKKEAKRLLRPTRLYVRPFLYLADKVKIKGAANITGGGFIENIPRILPSGIGAVIEKKTWTVPAVFKSLWKEGEVSEIEMYRTFNMGIGMVVIMGSREAAKATKTLFSKFGLKSWVIGKTVKGKRAVTIV